MESINSSCDYFSSIDQPKILTPNEIIRLKADKPICEFKRVKLEREASNNWDKFYRRNRTNFFKDRHWTKADLQALCPDIDFVNHSGTLFEAGCGVGNFLFPFLDQFSKWSAFACDFSPRAIQFVKTRCIQEQLSSDRCSAFVCDLTVDRLSMPTSNSIDLCTLIFVLSSIDPNKMITVITNIRNCIRPGGSIIVRDYGIYDHAMLRFEIGSHLIEDNFYVRQDGTRAYYFSRDRLEQLFIEAGFETIQCDYLHRKTVNRKMGISVERIFIQGRFRRCET